MFDILFCIAGVLAGIVTGLLPGFGLISAMMILYPFHSSMQMSELFIFYFSMMLTSQYYGSVSAIVYGIVGESSSVPATIYGNRMFNKGQGTDALLSTANSSAIGALFATLLTWAVVYGLHDYFYIMFKNSVKVAVITGSLAIIILAAKSRITAAIAIIIGIVLSKIGFDAMTQTRFLTFGIDALDAGLPTFPFLIGLLILPAFLKNSRMDLPYDNNKLTLGHKFRMLMTVQNRMSILRGSIIGALSGFIPSFGYVISSQLAASAEGRYNQDDKSKLVSTEAANNAASVTVLLPLLLGGIPIVASESMLISMAESKGFIAGTSYLLQFITPILWMFVAITFANWIISGILVQHIVTMFYKFHHWIYPIIIALCIAAMLYFAILSSQVVLSVCTLGVSYLLSIVLRSDENRIATIFAFFAASTFYDEIYRFFLL